MGKDRANIYTSRLERGRTRGRARSRSRCVARQLRVTVFELQPRLAVVVPVARRGTGECLLKTQTPVRMLTAGGRPALVAILCENERATPSARQRPPPSVRARRGCSRGLRSARLPADAQAAERARPSGRALQNLPVLPGANHDRHGRRTAGKSRRTRARPDFGHEGRAGLQVPNPKTKSARPGFGHEGRARLQAPKPKDS
jgi:hypothetical protein